MNFRVFRHCDLSKGVSFAVLIGALAVSAVLVGGCVAPVRAEDRIVTVWPLIDYRHSPEGEFTSVHILGPLVKYQRAGSRREYGLRPFYYHVSEEGKDQESDLLYPVADRRTEPENSSFNMLQLIQRDSGVEPEGDGRMFMVFPFIFSGQSSQHGEYFAFFPFGGTIYERFQRDEIHFRLFPLYSRTRKGDTTVRNYLWPFFAKIEGDQEEGIKVWPLYGASEKTGVYRKRFYLWPIFFRYDLKQNTANPVKKRAVFPLYLSEESPKRTRRFYLWPFFSYLEDREKDYREWNAPWPLVRIVKGENHYSHKYLPLYGDEKSGADRKRWFLWPIYKIEETDTDFLYRRRDRILFFLYSDLQERHKKDLVDKRRIAFWPLFTYERDNSSGRFYLLSLLEPFFPDNPGIERSWAPLWRLYQVQWDGRGGEVSSLLWNLYWKERRGPDVAWELFPLVRCRHVAGEETDVELLKGLFHFRSGTEGVGARLLFLPWIGHSGRTEPDV